MVFYYHGRTALIFACQREHGDIARMLLLEFKADTEIQNRVIGFARSYIYNEVGISLKSGKKKEQNLAECI